jgi:hypothetical protein
MKRGLSLGILVLYAMAWAASPAAAATPAECEAKEAAARAEVSGHATEAETNEYAKGIAAPCWEEVRQAEERARQEQQTSEEREREEAQERHHPRGAPVPHYERKPTVREGLAIREALRLMHRRREWRQAYYRDLECRHGRINRFMWSCDVEWIPRGAFHCWKGRVLVEGWHFRDGYPWFKTQFRARDVCSD